MSFLDDGSIQSSEYDDELDLLTVTKRGFAEIYENKTGKFLKRIELEWPTDDQNTEWKHTCMLDKDMLVHLISNNFNGSCICTTYQISRD